MFRIGTDNENNYRKLLNPYLNNDGSLGENGYEHIETILQKAFRINSSFRCYEDAMGHIIAFRKQKQRQQFLHPFAKAKKLPVIKSLKVKPFPLSNRRYTILYHCRQKHTGRRYGIGKNNTGYWHGAVDAGIYAGAESIDHLPYLIKIPMAK